MKDVVAEARDSTCGTTYYRVRWATDDDGEEFAEGKEEETWEPAENVLCETIAAFEQDARRPSPSEKAAMREQMVNEITALLTPKPTAKKSKGPYQPAARAQRGGREAVARRARGTLGGRGWLERLARRAERGEDVFGAPGLATRRYRARVRCLPALRVGTTPIRV